MAIDDDIAALQNRTLQAIGSCLNAWGMAEIEISNLYMALHEKSWSDFSHPMRAAFEAVISLEVRLALIRAYVEADTALTDYAPHLISLLSRIMKLYKKRHQVAHFVIVSRFEAIDPNQPVLKGFYGIRPFFTWDGFTKQQGTELSAEQIEKRGEAFRELSKRLRRHVQHVGQLRKLPAEYFAQAGDLAYPPLTEADLNPEARE